MDSLQGALQGFAEAAAAPRAYAEAWKRATGGKAVGSFPMNFPAELVHAAGALPVIVQESRDPITAGRNLLPEFYCGYTRSVADQAAKGQLDVFDGFFFADHCIQLLGAVDAVRYELPAKPMHFGQFISSLHDSWSHDQIYQKMQTFQAELERFAGASITAEALSRSIGIFNQNRRLLREAYELRRSGRLRITASQMQVLVQSSMIMDKEQHTFQLAEVLSLLGGDGGSGCGAVRLHLSGHFCHAPRTELLDAIEECGVIVVDDDLYHGYRYISTDVAEDGDPLDALARWYLERNVSAPCPTRVQSNVDWDEYLISSLENSASDGVIVLMAKFCEPHMLHYPELRKALEARDIPMMLIETEHEGVPLESVRTRVEAFVEQIHRRKRKVAVHA
jgi:benzoyl-CoA reductase subunit C